MSIPDDIRERMREAGSGERAQARGREDRPGGDARGARAGAGRLRHAALQQGRSGGARHRGPAIDLRSVGTLVTRVRRRRSPASPCSTAPGCGASSRRSSTSTSTWSTSRSPCATRAAGWSRTCTSRTSRSSRTAGPRRSSSSRRRASPEERKELALNLGLLLDTSESMRKELRLCQEAAVRFLERDPARARPGHRLLRPATSASRATTARTSRGCSSASSKPRAAATPRSTTRSPSTSRGWPTRRGRKVLVLFTDGEDTTQPRSPRRRCCSCVRSQPR